MLKTATPELWTLPDLKLLTNSIQIKDDLLSYRSWVKYIAHEGKLSLTETRYHSSSISTLIYVAGWWLSVMNELYRSYIGRIRIISVKLNIISAYSTVLCLRLPTQEHQVQIQFSSYIYISILSWTCFMWENAGSWQQNTWDYCVLRYEQYNFTPHHYTKHHANDDIPHVELCRTTQNSAIITLL